MKKQPKKQTETEKHSVRMIRNIDDEKWRMARIMSAETDRSLGEVISEAIELLWKNRSKR